MHRQAQDIDGNELVRAKRWSEKSFAERVTYYRKRGHTDREILNAMVNVRMLIDAIGAAPPPKRPRYGKK